MTLRIGATACGRVAVISTINGDAIALTPAAARELADISAGAREGDFLPFVDVDGEPGVIVARGGRSAELAAALRKIADLAEAQTAVKQ